MKSPHWKDDPDEHDYPAAGAYLSLLMQDGDVRNMVDSLREAPLTHRKAKDILRASGLALLPKTNAHVQADLKKVGGGSRLSPVLVVRGRPALIADGYHRVCASYWLDENTDIPCKLA